MDDISQKVYCPKCKQQVGMWDGKSSSHVVVKCDRCMRLVVYDTECGETYMKGLPERNTASGIRFY